MINKCECYGHKLKNIWDAIKMYFLWIVVSYALRKVWNKKKKFETFQTTLFEIFIFCPKIQLWFHVKIVDFLGE